MCDSVQTGGLRQLHLWPRGHYKSTEITIGYSIWRIIQNPNIRILIANATLQNARAFLREIKGHFEKNTTFRDIYGDYTSREEKWTESEIIVSKRIENKKEPTIMVAGVGQSLTGLHFDLIVGDDLVNYDSVNTPEQIDKTRRWWGDAMSLLEPDGQIICIGTRYHYADLYGHIIDNLSSEYKPQIHSAYLEDGMPLFPTRFTLEKLEEIKKEQGSWMFSCQYLNSPIDDENAKFKRENLRYEDVLPDKQYFTTMVIDRAYSLAKTADFTGFTVRKVDQDNYWHIPYARRTKASEGKIVDMIFDLKNHYKVDKVGIEQQAFNDTLRPTLEEEMRRRNDFFEVIELKGRASKIARIEGLVPRFESQSIIFTGNKADFVDLEDELLRFPVAEHDDLVDSLAYHNHEDMAGGVTKNDFTFEKIQTDEDFGMIPKFQRVRKWNKGSMFDE